MKILYITTGLGIGGAELQLINVCNELVKSHLNYNITIISMTGEPKIFPDSDKIKVISLSIIKTNPFSIIKAFIKSFLIIKAFQPDIVHSHMVHANLFARILRIFIKMKKLICTAHSNNEGNSLIMNLYRYTDFLCDITTHVSTNASQDFISKKSFNIKKNITVYNGIDCNKFNFDSYKRADFRNKYNFLDSDFLIVNVARLDKAKDHENLLRAFALAAQKKPHLKLLLAGEGPRYSHIMDLIETLNIKNQVSLLGHFQDIPKLLSAADLFVLSSKWEGFSISLIEAMACKCVCISTDCGGPREIFAKTKNILIPPRDNTLLAASILKVLAMDLHEVLKIKNRNREKIIENYSIENAAARWREIYST